MPSKSKSQHNLMEAAAHGAKFAMAKKIPKKVAKEFVEADSAKKPKMKNPKPAKTLKTPKYD